jgi:hypothetical protein
MQLQTTAHGPVAFAEQPPDGQPPGLWNAASENPLHGHAGLSLPMRFVRPPKGPDEEQHRPLFEGQHRRVANQASQRKANQMPSGNASRLTTWPTITIEAT